MDRDPTSGLRGRRAETARLDQLLTGLRAGHSGVLVLHGEAGVGKTALLDHLVERATGCRTTRTAGIESEMELPFAGLHQFCTPFFAHLDRLPGPQRTALRTAFGLANGDAPDRFLVGLAVLSLLSDVAEERPLVCLVDDAQWLDHVSRQTLAFVARRLLAEAVALVFAVRERDDGDGLEGLAHMLVPGLAEDEAHALLDSVITGPLDDRVRDRIVAETRGNPLALLELPRGLSPAELAGGFGIATTPIAGRIEQGFRVRLDALPVDTRRLLLAAAAEPVGDATLLWRAAERLEVGAGAADPAEAAGLVEIGTRVRFRHPLVRTAVCRAASARELRDVHRALAEVTDPKLDPDRRAWHRARATAQPDEAVAEELERSASRAQARGGVGAAAGFLERATELTPDPVRRGPRALAAGQAKFDAGAPGAAAALLTVAEMCPLDPIRRALLERLRAQLTLARRQAGKSSSLTVLLETARRLEPLDAGLARETYLDALRAGIFAGRLGRDGEIEEVARAARTAPRASRPTRAVDLLLDGLAVRFTDGYEAAVPLLKEALDAFARERGRQVEDVRWLWLAWPVAFDVWDDELWHQLSVRLVGVAREIGALAILPMALIYRAQLHVQAGQFGAAAALLDEVALVEEAIGKRPLVYNSTAANAPLVLAAWQGKEARAVELIEDSTREGAARGEGRAISLADLAKAVLYNGLGRYDLALAAARRTCEHDDLALFAWGLVELVEASARSGHRADAEWALQRLQQRTQAVGTEWALGIEARCRALIAAGEPAERLYQEAIERLARTRIRVALARAHLLYGEWLRREGRRVDAREELHTAHDMLTEIGMEGFAGRARRELQATGESVRKRTSETRDDLTPREAHIARLAGNRATNSEIAVQMFISTRTVEWHLHKVFVKLGISSRRQIPGVLDGAGQAATQA